MSKDIIRISIPAVLEVSRSEWDQAYGTGTGAIEVRDNVREHILNMLHELTSGNSGAGDGAIKTVTPRWK
jgi:hypothetical protein